MLYCVCSIVVLIFSLLGVAFYTLFERKVLGLAQMRMGPNKVSINGVLQPLIDALKLLFKEVTKNSGKSLFVFLLPSFLLMGIMFQVWGCIPSGHSSSDYYFPVVLVIIMLGLLVYNAIMVGVVSSSKYGFLGGMRNACQSISYEISLSLQILSVYVLAGHLVLEKEEVLLVSVLFSVLWWISCVCECNRAPFDFAEGESELISGFNIEYSSVSFIFIFLGEYGMMLSLSLLTSTIFFGSSPTIFSLLFFSLILFRASFPRYRYDLLMKFCWTCVLPLSTALFFVIILI